MAPAVTGTLAPETALSRLLAGSGLGGRIDAGTIIVTPAVDAAPASGAAPVSTLQTISVSASADASAQGLAETYAGGQVARGGRVGLLGNLDLLDSPVTVTSYTNRLIQDQQARSVADVLLNDPTVRAARGFGNYQETYFIRGFLVPSDDMAYNGLFGLLPRQGLAIEMVERVELLRGASAYLYGATPSGRGIGGTVNIVPKRAPNEPLTQITVGSGTGSPFQIAADVARRFGPDDSAGIRLNAARREGGNGIGHERTEMGVATVGLDWRNSHTRLSADLGYQEHTLKGVRPNVSLGAGLTAVPAAPDARTDYGQPWIASTERDLFGTLRAEHDFNDAWTGWIAAGARRGKESNSLAGVTVNDLAGNGTFYRFDNRRQDDVRTAETGLRGTFQTGAVGHELVAQASFYEGKEKNAYAMDFSNTFPTNIYDPIDYARPPISSGAFTGNDLSDPGPLGRTRLTSVALGDTLSFYDDRLKVTLGGRYQRLDTTAYLYGTGAVDARYRKSRVSPMAGVVFRLREDTSVYANYIESLAKGDVAPTQANNQPVRNAGEILSPYVSRQKEIGIRYDGGRVGGSVALFSTSRPRSFVNADNVFVSSGNDRHQGVELSAFGEITRGLRVLGGVTWIDARQRETGNPTLDGKRVIGVPARQANIGLDWDVPGVAGLSLNTRLVATASRYADSANTLRVPGWARWDVGANYVTDIAGRLVTLRARVDNVTNRGYWASVGGYPDNGYLVLGAPRTVSLSASFEF
ncbi:TonB-dependent receptor [Achromobacter sp. GG226]|nr:TonB-dependent receptor [Verticiella sp. GG226]